MVFKSYFSFSAKQSEQDISLLKYSKSGMESVPQGFICLSEFYPKMHWKQEFKV